MLTAMLHAHADGDIPWSYRSLWKQPCFCILPKFCLNRSSVIHSMRVCCVARWLVAWDSFPISVIAIIWERSFPSFLFAVSCLFLMPITHNEILTIINSFDSSKISGAHNIPAKFIKLSANVIAPILCYLYNYSFTSGVFPDILKLAYVIPVHKSGPKEICNNYRRISLLSPFAKIFEKRLYNQLKFFSQASNYWTHNTSDFGKIIIRPSLSPVFVMRLCNVWMKER